MREERELAGVRAWNRRPYGDRTDQELSRLIATGPVDARREDEAAAAETERLLREQIAADKAGGQTRGRRETAPIYQLLVLGDEHLAVARTEQGRETATAAQAAAADEHLRVLAASEGQSRITLRLAGTSKKEHGS